MDSSCEEHLVGESSNISFKPAEIVLSFQHLSKNVTISAPTKKGCCVRSKKHTVTTADTKQILTDANGLILPGEIMAIMGPSGSGKTTLLNILACRNMDGVTGTVHLNSELMTKSSKRTIGYVLQEDIFFTNLTLREQLTFTALLRLPGLKKTKLSRVEEVLEDLNLQKCADTKILLLSGGEKKRLNIGTELLIYPLLLLLDEPTSGLDSTSAFSLMKTLQKLANQDGQKKTIVTSIHQPSSQVFQSFDKIMLLMNGQTVYYGKPSDAIVHFAELDFQCPEQYNAADFLLDVISDTKMQDKLTAAFSPPRESELKFQGKKSHNDNGSYSKGKKFPTSWCEQFEVLLQRGGKNSWSTLINKTNCYKCFGLAIAFSLCFWRMPFREEFVFDRLSLLFLILMFWPMDALFMGLMAWPAEKPIIVKERASGTYRLSAYFLAKSVAGIPAITVLPTVFLLLSYWMCGLNPSFIAFVELVLLFFLTSLSAESLGMLYSTSLADFKTAMTVCMLSMVTFLLLAGYFIKNLPPWLFWAKYLSIVYFPYQVGLALEFDGRELICDGSDKLIQCKNNSVYPGDVTIALGRELSPEIAVLWIAFIGVVTRTLAYFCLRFLSTNQGRT